MRSVLFLIIFAATASAGPAFTNDLIAHYSFANDGEDVLKKSPPFLLTNQTPFARPALYVDGNYQQNNNDHLGIVRPLPGLDYQSFTVGIDFYPLPAGVKKHRFSKFEKLLNKVTGGKYGRWRGYDQWTRRNLLTGGKNYRWIGFDRGDGVLNLTLNNQRFSRRFKDANISAGRWHRLDCSVDINGRQIATWLDGRKLETIALPADFKLDVIGTAEDANDREFTFMNLSNGSVFYGYAANLKVFGRALNDAELATLYAESLIARPRFLGQGFPLQIFILAALVAGLTLWMVVCLVVKKRRE